MLEETIRASAQLPDPPAEPEELVQRPIESCSELDKLPSLKPSKILTPLAPIPKEEDEKLDLPEENVFLFNL